MTRTTWAIRYRCPECGYSAVTQDRELADAMTAWHEERAHDGRAVCATERAEGVPVDAFPADEDPVVPSDSGGQEVVTLG